MNVRPLEEVEELLGGQGVRQALGPAPQGQRQVRALELGEAEGSAEEVASGAL